MCVLLIVMTPPLIVADCGVPKFCWSNACTPFSVFSMWSFRSLIGVLASAESACCPSVSALVSTVNVTIFTSLHLHFEPVKHHDPRCIGDRKQAHYKAEIGRRQGYVGRQLLLVPAVHAEIGRAFGRIHPQR